MGVDRETHQVGLQVDQAAAGRGPFPARCETVGNLSHRRKAALLVCRIERGHHHPPLGAPLVSIGAEHAGWQAQFGPGLVQPDRAPESIGAIAKERGHDLVIGDDDDPAPG